MHFVIEDKKMVSEIRLEIVGLIYNQAVVNTYGLVLCEKNGSRRFSIMIGEPEAQSIALKINNKVLARPLTHDLIKHILVTLKSELKKVLIYELANEIFYSELYIEDANGKIFTVDARTSDAVALAVRAECPIYIKSHILDIVGIEIQAEESTATTNTDKNIDSFTEKDWNSLSKTELTDLLDTAVKEEKYELAVKIRDVLKGKEAL